MKQILSSLFFVFIMNFLQAQITFQKTYNYSTSVVKLETQGYKYFLMDVPNSQCKLYNMDHSLYKTINCNVPSGYYLSDIKLISEKLFNSDSQIELAYTYYKYVATGNSYYYNYGSRIINENGTILQTIDGAQYIYVNKTGESEYKLFAYCFDYSVSPEKVWTNIYGLPGVYVSSTFIAGKTDETLFNVYPNPASETIRIDYQLPDNVNVANLKIIDSKGSIVNSYQIDNYFDHLALDVSYLTAGVYHYFIEFGNTKTETKRVIIQK